MNKTEATNGRENVKRYFNDRRFVDLRFQFIEQEDFKLPGDNVVVMEDGNKKLLVSLN